MGVERSLNTWQQAYRIMQGVSFISCFFYIDSLRRMRKTIKVDKRLQANHWLFILHLLMLILYFFSVITKSISESKYIQSKNNGASKE